MNTTFSARLISWQKTAGRNQLPWQNTRDPYRIWLSEIMLQQTQVSTVIPYFLRFLDRFPTVKHLAEASQEEVLALWSGLGYYSRARNLHKAAQTVIDRFSGVFPTHSAALETLPGIGRSTAAAIAAFSSEERSAILDGNVKRVLARHAGIDGYPGDKRVADQLWREAEARLPQQDMIAYTQGLMDLGSLICTRNKPGCEACPVNQDCVARRSGRTAELPGRKPRKATPEKETVMLLVQQEQKWLLQRRPEKGIWAGLWSLPECPATLAASDWAQAHGLKILDEDTGSAFTHVFTHFRLHITPHRLQVVASGTLPDDCVWHSLSEALAAGIPTPVRRLLEQYGPRSFS